MGKKSILFCLLFITPYLCAQTRSVESLKQALRNSPSDQEKIESCGELAVLYSNSYPDTAAWYADRIIDISSTSGNIYGQALGYLYKGWALERVSNFPMALNMAYSSLRLAEGIKDTASSMMGRAYNLIGGLNAYMGKDSIAKQCLYQSISLLSKPGGMELPDPFTNPYASLGFVFLITGRQDSALHYARKAYEAGLASNQSANLFHGLIVLGNVYKHQRVFDTARFYYRQALDLERINHSPFYHTLLLVEMAGVYFDSGNNDSCIHYAKEALAIAQKYGYKLSEINATGMLYFQYEQNLRQTDSAHKYLQALVFAKDHVFNEARIQQFQLYAFDEAQRLKDLEIQKKQIQTQVRMYAMLSTIVVFVLIAYLLYRNNRQKQLANQMLEKTLAELKATQAQLIQAEKMASLGELTAGIAHEIQNPLNFVNNFSEINQELLQEIQDERNAEEKGQEERVPKLREEKRRQEKGIIVKSEILESIRENQEKILQHGKRADAIVKSMLEHSRVHSGQKASTDLNVLCDEFLRLAYHGFRAKDKDFNSGFKLELDPDLPRINTVPQEIGRVLLNLINNAFYSVQQRSKTGETDYQPMVTVSTKRTDQGLEIRVRDNGEGIPESIRVKIFQPFFTTKPTGQGTGLGLSLAYDIVTKGHGGSLKVVSEIGAGTEFIVELPT